MYQLATELAKKREDTNTKTRRNEDKAPLMMASNNDEVVELRDSDATEPLPSSDEEGKEEELWISSGDEEQQPIPEEQEPLPDERDWPPITAVAVARAPIREISITTLTDHHGNVIPRTVGRPRTNSTRFLAVTSDPFYYRTGAQLKFVIRGKPAAKRRPGFGLTGNWYNTTSGLENEFLDVAMKLFQNKEVNPQFGRAPLYIHVKSFFPREFEARISNGNGVGDCNNLLNFVQDSLQGRVFHDDGQIMDAQATKIICEQYGRFGYTTVCITRGRIQDFCFL